MVSTCCWRMLSEGLVPKTDELSYLEFLRSNLVSYLEYWPWQLENGRIVAEKTSCLMREHRDRGHDLLMRMSCLGCLFLEIVRGLE